MLKPGTFKVGDSLFTLRPMLGTLAVLRVAITVPVADRPCLVHADRKQFDTAIVNMAANARDAMHGEGTLTISVGGEVVVESGAGVGSAFTLFLRVRLRAPLWRSWSVICQARR